MVRDERLSTDSSLRAGFFDSPHLTVSTSGPKIKIVENQKPSWVQGFRRARSLRPSARPYTLRVARDHGGGLWTFEDDRGQLYLGVLSRENSDFRRLQGANLRVAQEYLEVSPEELEAAG